MSVKEICDLPIKKMRDINSVLFLWTTTKFIKDAFVIMEKWGFKYHNIIVWNKQKGPCVCGFNRITEYLLFGYSGKYPLSRGGKAIKTLITIAPGKHGEKPDIFRQMITNNFEGNKIELFARGNREKDISGNNIFDGWDVWGNEVESNIVISPSIE